MRICENGVYREMTQEEIQSTVDFNDVSMQIESLKQCLAETDYAVIKIAEGAATRDEYAEIIAERQKWRDEINRLQDSTDNRQDISSEGRNVICPEVQAEIERWEE